MSIENKQDEAEPTPASDGSVTAEPVAWLVTGDGYEYATLLKEHAEVIAEEEDGVVVPLYRKPTLTDAERAFLELHAERLISWGRASPESRAERVTVIGLLERLG